MTSTVEGAIRIRSRERANIGWSELLPRYLLIEEALAGRRALEIGILDPRSLFRIHDASAARVVGTSPHAARFEPALFRGRRIELLAMEPGRVDFDNGAFDAIIVSDLSVELAANARFLEEVRRVLSPDGFCLIGFQASGRSWVELADQDDGPLLLEPLRLEEAVRAAFPGARFYRQAPFIGVAIQPQDIDPKDASVSLEPSLAGPEPPASHVIALAGTGAPDPEERTLIELPFTEFEAMTEVAKARSAGDLRRALIALKEARSAAETRERSLRAIGDRLPKIKAAIAERNVKRAERVEEEAARGGGRGWAADLESGIDTKTEALSAVAEKQAGEIEVLQRALASREQAIRAIDGEANELRQKAEYHQSEAADLRARIEELEAELATRPNTPAIEQSALLEQARTATIEAARAQRAVEAEAQRAAELAAEQAKSGELESELREAERRVLHLERTTGAQEQRLEELRIEHESQVQVRHALGSDFRDAEARIAYLSRRLEDQSLERSETIRGLNQRLQEATEALSRSDQDRDTLRARLMELESGASELSEGASRAERALQALRADLRTERHAAEEARRDLDAARHEALERSEEASWLRRAAADRDAEIVSLRTQKAAVEADLRAVELTAAHLVKELDGLKIKNQAIAYERDALATTSRMLLEERDAAAELAKRTLEADDRARESASALEGAQAAIDRLERELKEGHHRETSLALKVESLQREEGKLRSEQIRFSAAAANEARRAERAEVDRAELAARLVELDQHIAKLEHRLAEGARSRDGADRTIQNLEEMLRETVQEVREARRETDLWKRRSAELDEAAQKSEQEILSLHAARATTEAALVDARTAALELHGRAVLLAADLEQAQAVIADLAERANRSEEIEALEARLRGAEAERQEMEVALSATLQEAAALHGYMRDLEVEADAKNQALEQGERERLVIERQREEAELARAVAEETRSALSREAFSLRHYLAASENETEELQREATALRNEAETWRREAEANQSEAKALLRAVVAQKSESEARARALSALQAEAEAWQKELSALQSEVEARQSQVERLSEALAAKDRSNAALESARGAGGGEVSEALDEVRLIRVRICALEGALEDARAARLCSEIELEDARDAARLLEAKLRDARRGPGAQQAAGAQVELAPIRATVPARAAGFPAHPDDDALHSVRRLSQQQRIFELEASKAELAAIASKLEADLALAKLARERDRSSARRDVANLSEALGEARAQLERVELEVEAARAARVAAEPKASALLSRIAETDRELQETLNRAEGAEARIEVAEALAKYFEDRSNSADAKIQALEWEAGDAGARVESANARIAELSVEVEKAAKHVQEAHAVARDADASVTAALARLDTSERRRADIDLRLEEMITALGQAEAAASELEARAMRAESELLATKNKMAEAARAGGPVPGDELRRLAARATDAEQRARKAEQLASQSQSTADAVTLRAAQAEARALKGEERADRAEAGWRKTDALARQAEARATQAESLARQLEQRAREVEARHRAADAELDRVRRELTVANARLLELSVRGVTGGAGASLALKSRCESLEASVAYRDGELKRLKSVAEQTALELDQARAEVGKKLAEIRGAQHALDASKQEVTSAWNEIDQLRAKLARQGDAELLAGEVEKRNQEIARINAEAAARAGESSRLRALLQEAEQAQVQLERRIGELESALEEGDRRIELLKRDLAEKAERLRRFSGLPES